MTTTDKQAAIAALGGPEKARYMIERVCNGDRFRDAGRASSAVRALALSALEADDGRALLRHLREWVLDEIDPADRQQCVVDKIDSLLAAEPAQTAEPAAPRRCGHRSPGECSIACHTPDVRGLHEKFTVRRTDGRDAPGQKHHGCDYFVLDLNHDEGAPAAIRAYASAVEQTRPQLASDLRSKFGIATLPPAGAAPAGDDEARIAECMHRVGQAMLSMRHDWMLCVYDRDNPEDQKRKEAVESIGEAFALMREILSRAVKAEGDLRDVTRRNASWCEHQHSVLRDLRAKLAEAEKARDAAIAAQNARAVEELEALRNWWLGKYNGSIGTVVLVDKIGLRLAALRSSPPAAPAGEAPAQGAGDDDTLCRFLRFGEDIPRGGERLLSVVADLCRRELARGER